MLLARESVGETKGIYGPLVANIPFLCSGIQATTVLNTMLSYNAAITWQRNGVTPLDAYLTLPGDVERKQSLAKKIKRQLPTENKALYEGAYFESTAHADLSVLETHIDMLGINLVNLVLPETATKS